MLAAFFVICRKCLRSFAQDARVSGMHTQKTIFFVGKPGCGKGTQVKILAEKTGWQVVSAGEQFRTLSKEETPVGRKLKAQTEKGDLAPHWFAMYLYLKALFALNEDTNVIFDGFNRTVPEAGLLVDSLAWLERPFIIVYLAVSDEAVRSRLAKRKEIEGRADDAAVEERLKEYYKHTDPAIEIFRDAGVLIEIDGERPSEAISADIAKMLEL